MNTISSLLNFIGNFMKTVSEPYSITRTGGAAGATVNTTNTGFVRCGKTVTVTLAINPATEPIASGGNIFTGTLNTTKLIPASDARLICYLGSRAIIGAIGPTGSIVVRNSTPSELTMTGTMYPVGTYLIN